ALKTKWFSKGRKRSRAAPFILAAAAIVGGPLWRCAMVRCAWGFVAFGLLLLTGVGRADDNECRAIIDKSIKAVGGSGRLCKYKAETWKEKGTFYGEGAAQPYTGNYAVQWPDQFRMEIEGVFTLVLNGDKGSFKEGGQVREMTKEQLAQQKESQYAGWVA